MVFPLLSSVTFSFPKLQKGGFFPLKATKFTRKEEELPTLDEAAILTRNCCVRDDVGALLASFNNAKSDLSPQAPISWAMLFSFLWMKKPIRGVAECDNIINSTETLLTQLKAEFEWNLPIKDEIIKGQKIIDKSIDHQLLARLDETRNAIDALLQDIKNVRDQSDQQGFPWLETRVVSLMVAVVATLATGLFSFFVNIGILPITFSLGKIFSMLALASSLFRLWLEKQEIESSYQKQNCEHLERQLNALEAYLTELQSQLYTTKEKFISQTVQILSDGKRQLTTKLSATGIIDVSVHVLSSVSKICLSNLLDHGISVVNNKIDSPSKPNTFSNIIRQRI